jgi:hypothetical protein
MPGDDKEVDPLVVARPVGAALHHSHNRDIPRRDRDPRLFLGLASRRSLYRLIAVEMPGDNAIVSVRISSVRAAQEQDLAITKQEEMDGDNVPKTRSALPFHH